VKRCNATEMGTRLSTHLIDKKTRPRRTPTLRATEQDDHIEPYVGIRLAEASPVGSGIDNGARHFNTATL
jgi:hypothetical protein